MKTVYVTKYALSEGIVKREVSERNDKYVWVIEKRAPNGERMYRAAECFDDFNDALVAAHRMRLNRIKSLERQIEKLKLLSFAAGEVEG